MLWFNACGVMEAGRLAEKTTVDMVKLRDALLTSSGGVRFAERMGSRVLYLGDEGYADRFRL